MTTHSPGIPDDVIGTNQGYLLCIDEEFEVRAFYMNGQIQKCRINTSGFIRTFAFSSPPKLKCFRYIPDTFQLFQLDSTKYAYVNHSILGARAKFYELPKSRIDFAECINDHRFEFSRVGVHLFFERGKRKEENNKGRDQEMVH